MKMTEENGNKLLKDFAFLPALLDDYGYYLIKKNVDPFIHQTDDVDCGGCIHTHSKKSIKNFVLMDKKLKVVSIIDFLHWERDKYRIYIDTLRLSQLCGPTSDPYGWLGLFIGKMALATATKCGYTDLIHSDYAIVGTDRVPRATEKERRQDIQMIHKVHAILSGRTFLDATSSYTLFPNLKANYSGVFQLDEEEKKLYQKICHEVCDVSVVWQCGVKRRVLLRKNGVYRWDDPAFQDHFYGMVSGPLRIDVVRKMISLSLSSGGENFLFPPKQKVLDIFPILEKKINQWVFVDFETDYQKCIYMLGHYTKECGYQCEWADHLDPGSEKPLMHKIYNVLSSYKKNNIVICYFVAEMNFWKERCQFHRLEQYMDLFDDGAFDLSHLFIYSPLIIRDVFNFKLKNIASKLYELGCIRITQPEGCMDGAQSVDLAKEYYRTRSPDIAGVLERYNQFDCQVLYEMVVFLQKYYYLYKD